jgi:phasin family protein
MKRVGVSVLSWGALVNFSPSLRARTAQCHARIKQEKQMAQSRNTKVEQHQDSEEQSEIVRDPLESGLNNSIRMFQEITGQFSRVWGFDSPRAEEMTRRSSQNIEAVSQAGMILAKGGQEISRQWFDVIQDRLVKNINAMNKLAGVRSFQDFVTFQTEIARDRFGHAVESSRRIAEISARVTGEAAQVIQSQAGRNVVEFSVGSPRRVA